MIIEYQRKERLRNFVRRVQLTKQQQRKKSDIFTSYLDFLTKGLYNRPAKIAIYRQLADDAKEFDNV